MTATHHHRVHEMGNVCEVRWLMGAIVFHVHWWWQICAWVWEHVEHRLCKHTNQDVAVAQCQDAHQPEQAVVAMDPQVVDRTPDKCDHIIVCNEAGAEYEVHGCTTDMLGQHGGGKRADRQCKVMLLTWQHA